MTRILPVLLLLFASSIAHLTAQTPAMVLVKITPQVLEADQAVSWETELEKKTLAGTPVVVNIDADALSIRITVTPYARGNDFLLVVQGDVRQTGRTGGRLSTTVQSLLVPAGVPIAFFPLGRESGHARQMVVLIRVEGRDE